MPQKPRLPCRAPPRTQHEEGRRKKKKRCCLHGTPGAHSVPISAACLHYRSAPAAAACTSRTVGAITFSAFCSYAPHVHARTGTLRDIYIFRASRTGTITPAPPLLPPATLPIHCCRGSHAHCFLRTFPGVSLPRASTAFCRHHLAPSIPAQRALPTVCNLTSPAQRASLHTLSPTRDTAPFCRCWHRARCAPHRVRVGQGT